MSLWVEYRGAQHQERVAKLRRALALLALVAAGSSQREIAHALGVTQPAVSQQLKAAQHVTTVLPDLLLEAAAPILIDVARTRGFDRLAVYGSVARGQARTDSDVDLLVEPADAGIKDVVALRDTFQAILGRPVDLVTLRRAPGWSRRRHPTAGGAAVMTCRVATRDHHPRPVR